MRHISIFVGLSVLALILTMTIFFIVLKNNYKNVLNHFNKIVISTNLMGEFVQVYKEVEFQRLGTYNILSKNMTEEQINDSNMRALEAINNFLGKVQLFVDDDKNL